MTRCYEAYCEPFFSTKCCSKKPDNTVRHLVVERKRLIQKGVRFDRTDEDENKFRSLMTDKAHVGQANGVSEWFTPLIYLEAARELMGGIDVDPASTELGNKTVQATTYYTAEQDGRLQKWPGRVWMNPPYAQPLVSDFCDLFVSKYKGGEIEQGCILVNNATETAFFQNMIENCAAICLVSGRVRFLDENGRPGAPLQGQAILYFGSAPDKFAGIFRKFGVILYARNNER